MKKLVKKISICLVLVCCFVVSGCSCASPMKIVSNVTAVNENNGQVLTTNIDIIGAIYKKFREPVDTPCYKKMEEGYRKLELAEEIQKCNNGNCYVKVSRKEYRKIENNTEVAKCLKGDTDCYEYVAIPYYKLIENPEGIYKCYDADGNYFERTTYSRDEKYELEKPKTIISNSRALTSYTSEVYEIPSNKAYGLLYTFEIKNNESSTIYIKALEIEALAGDLVKKESLSKFKLKVPEDRVFVDNKYYYSVASGQKITISVEIKNLLTSDMTDKGQKEFNLNIQFIVK